jgi:DNA-binding MarR family transcriptional regulator
MSKPAPTSASGLDLPHDDGLLGHVVRVTTAVDRVLDDIAGRHGVSAADYLVLGVVRHSPGHRSSPTAIAEVLDRTTGGMSLALDRLEAAGWLQRRPDPADGRRVVVEATPVGIALAKRVNDDLHRWEAALPLTPDQRQALATVLGDLTEALSSAR